MRYHVLIEHNETGKFVAVAPALPGRSSEGRERGVASANIQKASNAHLENPAAHGEPNR